MSPRKRRTAVLEVGEEPASLEEAEEAAADAEARAEAARARAEELRSQAGGAPPVASGADRRFRNWSWPRWLRLPPARTAALVAAVVLGCASLAATGYMMWQHHLADQQRQRAAEFSAAARQSVVTMMSLDPATVRQDMQHVIENSAGKFKDALQAGGADEIAKRVEQSKVSTKITIKSVAVESMTANSADVLVAATSEGTGPDNKQLPPVTWRISVSLTRDGEQLKTSQLEFVQ